MGEDIIDAETCLTSYDVAEVTSSPQINFLTETTFTPAVASVTITISNAPDVYKFSFTLFIITADMDDCISLMTRSTLSSSVDLVSDPVLSANNDNQKAKSVVLTKPSKYGSSSVKFRPFFNSLVLEHKKGAWARA